MANKLINPAPIIRDLADRCLATKGLECSVLGSVIDMLKAAPRADAVEVSRLGKLGRLMMPYKGCPRGRMGAIGVAGGKTTVTEIHIRELDAIVDVEGDRWIPVLAEDLEILKARANNAMDVVRCEDCQKWDTETSVFASYEEALIAATYGQIEPKGHICKKWSLDKDKRWTKAEDFCSYGERREDNATG